MLSNAEFWVAVAFVIFMVIAWRMGAFRTLLDALDTRSRRIRAELDEAQKLRAEADALLAQYKRRQDEAEREAHALIAAARDDAERIGREAQERMADFVRRRTAAAEQKIAMAEANAAQQVRAAAADAAIRVSETVLREQMRGNAGEDLMARSLAEIRGKLHS